MNRPVAPLAHALALGALLAAGCGTNKLADGLPDDPTGCRACHGNDENAAPPSGIGGTTSTAALGVGAHQSHLRDSAIRKSVGCDECHVVPAAVDAEGHLKYPAPVVFGALATKKSSTPAWDRRSATCSATYCHGGTLEGGDATTPVWTTVDGSQARCGSCHGYPPPPPHLQNAHCGGCHPATVAFDDTTIKVEGGKHIDGTVELVYGCNGCHGSADNYAPPVDTSGNSATTARGVGAHQLHVRTTKTRKLLDCSECHVVPTGSDSVDHMNGAVEVVFGALATTGPSAAEFSAGQLTCSAVYCHGATLEGGLKKTPVWTFGAAPEPPGKLGDPGCDNCHGTPPESPHPQNVQCDSCHAETVAPDGTLLVDAGKHIDGNLDLASACNSCHGDAAGNPAVPHDQAPPVDTHGNSATNVRGVGAHQRHLNPPGAPWHAAVTCDQCHKVPVSPGDAGHMNGAVEIVFGGIADARGVQSSWSTTGLTCATYCHGERDLTGLGKPSGAAEPTPTWTAGAGNLPGDCTACHGLPPPNHYTTDLARCADCHGGVVSATNPPTIVDPAKHMNGIVNATGAGGCGVCHAVPGTSGAHATHYGDATTPPKVDYGETNVTADYYPGGSPNYLFGCGNCHPIDRAKHMDGTVEVELYDSAASGTSVKALNPASASYDPVTGVCSNVYCHGNGQASPSRVLVASPGWTSGVKTTCRSCHDNPPRDPTNATTGYANMHVTGIDWSYAQVGHVVEAGHFGGMPGHIFHGDYHGQPDLFWQHQATPSIPWPDPSKPNASPMTCQTCHFESVDPFNVGASGAYYLDTEGDYRLPNGERFLDVPTGTRPCEGCHTGVTGAPARQSGKAWSLRHVNGVRDVVFDPREQLNGTYAGMPVAPAPSKPNWVRTSGSMGVPAYLPPDAVVEQPGRDILSTSLASASYDRGAKTCSNVACHLWQGAPVQEPTCGELILPPKWGETGRWNCDRCHQIGPACNQ